MRILNRLFARVWNFGFGRRGDERPDELDGGPADHGCGGRWAAPRS